MIFRLLFQAQGSKRKQKKTNIYSPPTQKMVANGPISTFVPIIISGFGFSTLNSLLLIMPSGLYTGTLQLAFSYLAYRYRGVRCWLVVAAQLGTTLASLLLWLLPGWARGGLLYACFTLSSVGAGYAVLMGMQIANTAGYTKRSIASSGLFVGYCLGRLCPRGGFSSPLPPPPSPLLPLFFYFNIFLKKRRKRILFSLAKTTPC